VRYHIFTGRLVTNSLLALPDASHPTDQHQQRQRTDGMTDVCTKKNILNCDTCIHWQGVH